MIACVFTVVVLASLGALMTNYAWREAQWEELRASVRAAVSAAGPLLARAGGETQQLIVDRVSEFVQALQPDLELDDVTVAYDEDSGVTTVTVSGQYVFQDLWVLGGGEVVDEQIEHSTSVRFETDRYEVAVALDVSYSMGSTMPKVPLGEANTRIDGLKSAMRAVLDVTSDVISSDPGSMMLSLVPFASAVNVADTCDSDPDSGRCRAGRTAAKERYVRMLAGPHETRSAMLQAARDSAGQWVDTFHHYGAGSNLGPLREMSLPAGVLDDSDWNLRREDVSVDVSGQVPSAPTWVVNDEDFWNGCVMARWGAYWNPEARLTGWEPDDAGNWPAVKSVAGWSAAADGLPADTPLHLSDAPPDADDPNTLFTAYSWPDARIRGQADHVLQGAMVKLLESSRTGWLETGSSTGDNNWSFREDRGGASLCPPSPLTPLSDDVDDLRGEVNDLRVVRRHVYSAATLLPLGIVWGLRSLSPLWRDIWQVSDLGNSPRPAIPCAPGEAGEGCDATVHKSILIVSDGDHAAPAVGRRMLIPRASRNPDPGASSFGFCGDPSSYTNYRAASLDRTEDAFNSRFSAYVDASGDFDPGRVAAMDNVLDAFGAFLRRIPVTPRIGQLTAEQRAQRALLAAALDGVSPWQIFRGYDDAGAIDALLDPANGFGFEGRPVEIGHFCRWSSLFTPYGRVDDAVRVGESGGALLEPVTGVAPFSVPSAMTQALTSPNTVRAWVRDRLDEWFQDVCRIAGLRRVRINAIYIGNSSLDAGVATLKSCVALAGGDPERDVYVTPTSESLEEAFLELFTVRRNLRFLD